MPVEANLKGIQADLAKGLLQRGATHETTFAVSFDHSAWKRDRHEEAWIQEAGELTCKVTGDLVQEVQDRTTVKRTGKTIVRTGMLRTYAKGGEIIFAPPPGP